MYFHAAILPFKADDSQVVSLGSIRAGETSTQSQTKVNNGSGNDNTSLLRAILLAVDRHGHTTAANEIGSPNKTLDYSLQTFDATNVLSKFLISMSTTCYYLLALHNGCISFQNYIPTTSTVGESMVSRDGLGTWVYKEHAATGYHLLSARATWLASGTMVLYLYSIAKAPYLRGISASGWYETERNKGNLMQVAPMGWRANITAQEQPSNHAQNHEHQSTQQLPARTKISQWKQDAKSFLEKRGISVPESAPWIYVEITMGGQTILTENLHGPVHFVLLWPANLCIGPNNDGYNNSRGTEEDWNSVLLMEDPLVVAEQWLQKTEEPGEPTNIRQTSKNADRRESESTVSSNEYSILDHVFESATETQAATVIYPTPSDGPGGTQDGRSLVERLGMDASTPMTAPSPSVRLSTNAQLINQPSNDQTSPDIEMDQVDYDHLDGDDLFGDMDADFAGNGLTEDDFNFFDTPDEIHLPHDVASPKQATVVHSDAIAADETDVNSHIAGTKVFTSRLAHIEVIQRNPTEVPGGKQTIKNWEDEPMVEQVIHSEDQPPIVDTIGLDSRDILENDDKVSDGIPFLDSLYLKSDIPFQNFEGKYAANGRFASKTTWRPISSHPVKPLPSVKTVPRLDDTLGQNHNSDLESGMFCREDLF